MPTLLISDLHLCPSRPPATRHFLDFLAGPARGADALYILGDLFEYWPGDDALGEAFNAGICAALRALSDASVALFFMAGNRDFLVGKTFARAAGLTLLPDPATVELAGTRTLLMHGDTLCTEDHAYQAFRREVRSDDWLRAFLTLPLAARKAQIEALREESEEKKRGKSAEITDADPSAVLAAMRAAHCVRLIHGHTHRPAQHLMQDGAEMVERWVLPDWYKTGGYLACDAEGCKFLDWPA